MGGSVLYEINEERYDLINDKIIFLINKVKNFEIYLPSIPYVLLTNSIHIKTSTYLPLFVGIFIYNTLFMQY